jgi:hypothetical protein
MISQIINQAIKEIEILVPEISRSGSIYGVPVIEPLPSMGNLEIQVAVGDVRYPEEQGGIRFIDFSFVVGIFVKSHVDYRSKPQEILQKVRTSLYTQSQTIILGLDGSFFDGLLTRPARIALSTTVNKTAFKEIGLYWQMLVFNTGVNECR